MTATPDRKTRIAAASKDEIYEQMLNAISEHSLPPGTKLTEDRLAAIFNVSRTQIRLVLTRLSHEMLVEMIPNRGAFIASPTPEDARQVFDARRLIEPHILRHLCAAITRADIAQLRQHVQAEQAARERQDRRSVVRLSGEFHLLLADLSRHRMLAKQMRELVALTCLIILLYDAPTSATCPCDEHKLLVDALDAGREDKAVQIMLEHLMHIESALMLDEQAEAEIDLEAVFARRQTARSGAPRKRGGATN